MSPNRGWPSPTNRPPGAPTRMSQVWSGATPVLSPPPTLVEMTPAGLVQGAGELGLSLNAVLLTKSRVLKTLCQEAAGLSDGARIFLTGSPPQRTS